MKNLGLHQGSLDSLCGIYSVINSISLLNKKIDSSELFEAIVRRIDDRCLPAILLEGMSAYELEEMVLPACIEHCAKQNFKIRYKVIQKFVSLDTFWNLLKEHSQQHGAGSILLALWGAYDHWTCVKKVTNDSLLLLDSYNSAKRAFVRRSSISINKHIKRRHLLVPKWTYLLFATK